MKPEFRVSAPVFLALLFCAVLPLFLSGCARSADADQFQVTYYYRAGCGECSQATASVASLEKDFPGKVRTRTLDVSSPDEAKMVRLLGFKDHGLVIRGRNGAVLYKDAGHELKLDVVRQQIRDLLAFHEQQARL